MQYKDITKEQQENYTITTAGVHIFTFTNKSGELTFTIKHPNAKVYIFSTYSGTKNNHYTLKTIQKHIVPGAESHILIKGIFTDASHFDYSGLIKITKDAPNTHATLVNRNLILSDNVSITTIPQLEVFPSDVQCTHAATVATIDQEQCYYLMQRGITKKAAHDIIAHGFLDDIHQQIQALKDTTQK